MQTVDSLVCEIELPAGWQEGQRSAWQLADDSPELRRYPRYSCHGDAAMRCRETLPAISRERIWSRVLLQSISRCGAGFLHSEQLFPDEQALIVLPNGSQRILRVMRCRRLGPKCFEIGGEFADSSEKR